MSISKWNQYKYMLRIQKLTPYLPDTVLFTKFNFWRMLEFYEHIVIKPNWGKSGYNILFVSLIDKNEELYEIHHENIIKIIKGKNLCYSFIQDFCWKKKFIVQERIRLATVYNCPFDVRVMAQRLTRSSKWRITGKLARIAEQDFLVTNVTQKPTLLEELISISSVKDCSLEAIDLNIEKVVFTAANSFRAIKPNCRMIGFDVGILENGDISIIEANFHPMLSLFNYLDDKTMYRRILKYKRGGTR